MPEIIRIAVPEAEPRADANIRRQYEIQKAAWLWHPDVPAGVPAFLQFRNEFTAAETAECTIHVSADQRYELSLNGQLISVGPERGDVLHWGFSSYAVTIPAGVHLLEALVWWQGDNSPEAQLTFRGGFILEAGGELGPVLSTGLGNWETALLHGVTLLPWETHDTHTAGPTAVVNGAQWHGADLNFVPAAVIMPPVEDSPSGTAAAGWHLLPSDMAEQHASWDAPGIIRAVCPDREIPGIFRTDDLEASLLEPWNLLLTEGEPVTVPARSRVSVLWDLQEYCTGYSWLNTGGGAGAEIRFEWAEALFATDAEENMLPYTKGERDAVCGKVYFGKGDRFLPAGGAGEEYRSFGWRSGRFIMLTVITADEDLSVNTAGIRRTGYPLRKCGVFSTPDDRVNSLLPLLEAGVRACCHDAFIDTPYYGQLSGAGTVRQAMLAGFMIDADARPAARSLRLAGWSLGRTGFVAEAYPSRSFSLNPILSMHWVAAVRDFAWWRNNQAAVRNLIPGVRMTLEHLRMHVSGRNLLENLPGRPVLDRIPGWPGGLPAGGGAALNTMLFIYVLQQASELESAFGDRHMAERHTALARAMGEQVYRLFWDGRRGLMRDDADTGGYSEHAQCLALLAAVLPEAEELECLHGLQHDASLVRASAHFSFFILEALYRFNRGGEILKRLEPWHHMAVAGLRTPAEYPEPAAADCSAGTLHPLYHLHAGLAGIRPVEPGFKTVMCAPTPGPLESIMVDVPHPAGSIRAEYDFTGGRGHCRAKITLPPGVEGFFHWRGSMYPLEPGRETAVTAGNA